MPRVGFLSQPTASPYTLDLAAPTAISADLSVTLPRGDGTFVRGSIGGVALDPLVATRLVVDLARPTTLAVERDADGESAIVHALREFFVEVARSRIARGMIVNKNDTRRAVFDRGVKNLARLRDDHSGATRGNFFFENEALARVETKESKNFFRRVAEPTREVCGNLGGGAERARERVLFGFITMRDLEERVDERGFRWTDALCFRKLRDAFTREETETRFTSE